MKKIIFSALMATVLVAGEDGLDLSPAPISQMQMKDGDAERRVRLTSITASYDDYDVAGAAVQVGRKDGKAWGATNFSGSFLALSGGDDTSDAVLTSVNLSYLFEKYNGTDDGNNLTLLQGRILHLPILTSTSIAEQRLIVT